MWRSLTGETFGRWSVLGGPRRERRNRNDTLLWRCRCSCGTERWVDGNNLRAGQSKSCGCLQREVVATRSLKHGGARGRQWERLFTAWRNMIRRCERPGTSSYEHYGGRGITICQEWRASYAAFREWAMAAGYAPDLSIDRIDNDGNYEPSNCRWVTQAAQMNNTSRRRTVAAFGEVKSLADWARDPRCVVTPRSLQERLTKLGWTPERAITIPRGLVRPGPKRPATPLLS